MTTLILSEKPQSTIEPVPQGMHAAVCVGLYDVGVIPSEKFGVARRKEILTWEGVDLPPLTLTKDGKSVQKLRHISRRFTMSLHEKATLRRTLESWRGNKFTETEL